MIIGSEFMGNYLSNNPEVQPFWVFTITEGIPEIVFVSGILIFLAHYQAFLGDNAEHVIGVGMGVGTCKVVIPLVYTCFKSIMILIWTGVNNAAEKEYSMYFERDKLSYVYRPFNSIFDLFCYMTISALIILGSNKRRKLMVLAGILLFIANRITNGYMLDCSFDINIFYIKKMIINFSVALICVPFLIYCYKQWNSKKLEADSVMENVGEDISIR
jgi:hypothetical protein